MLKRFLLFFLVFSISAGNVLDAQKSLRKVKLTKVCYASGKVNRIYIPPPKEYYEKKDAKGLASVTITYFGFSQPAKTAMDMAASILSSILPKDARVTIVASWETIKEANVLAQTSVTGFAQGSEINARIPDAYYPIALAEKIAGRKLNEDADGDLFFAVNSSINWYLGTDGRPSTQQYDLITVAIHEICHGLGFYDSFYTNNNTAGYGLVDSIPMIYDTFLEDEAGRRLVDPSVYVNPSANLYSAVTGGQVWFDAPLTRNYRESLPAIYKQQPRTRIYAPTVWDAGSSISHLDDATTLPADALMTPFIDKAEVIHNPGKLTMSILGDLGWINTRIVHLKASDTEEHITQLILNASIRSDTTYNRNKVGLVYSYNNFAAKDTIILTPAGLPDTYTATIPVPSYETSLKYYFFVTDIFGRIFRSPSPGQVRPYEVYIGQDLKAPAIEHTPVEYYFKTVKKITINAGVVDNIGVDTVWIEYRKNNGPSSFMGLVAGKASIYTGVINVLPLALNGGDTFQYRIFARDKSTHQNVAVSPATGFYSVRIEEIAAAARNYSTDFTAAAGDFFNSGFTISQPQDFTSPGLHTKHPYEFTGRNDKHIEYTAMLRTPVLFDPNGIIISYREVVLVEPGEKGSEYGSPDFYDYVIVEASPDFGTNWYDIMKGYDSRQHPEWLTAYNSSLDADGNSKYIGKESLMFTHTAFPANSDSVSYGDTLLFRFRLFSDALSVGWGWAIDDLKIGPLINSVEDISAEKIMVYPNPGTGLINISSPDLTDKPFKFSVFNSAGIMVMNDVTSTGHSAINISTLPEGVYFIKLDTGKKVITIKYTLIR
jgi:hypothetical protein